MTRALLVITMTLLTVPAFAQIDISGTWAGRQHENWQERGPGPDPVDYLGLPLSDEGRAKALSYNYSAQAMLERQCGYYAPFYNVLGPQGLRIWSVADPIRGNQIVAWKLSGFIDVDMQTIWMDGRPHPPKNAFYPYSGFTTGAWEGDTLTTYTTHMKAGYIRRNGAPSSDQATMTQHIVRHGDILTITAVIEDPVYLTEPYIISRSWQLDPRTMTPATSSACEPIAEVPRLESEPTVPHYLPGENPFVNELTQYYNLPKEAVLGGAETMYPEFQKKLKDYMPPKMCTRYCCANAPGLRCIVDGSGRPAPEPAN